MPDPKLKTAAAEISAILKKHDVAGIVILSSLTHTEYLIGVDPSWSPCFSEETPKGKALRFRAKRADYPSKAAHHEAVGNGVGLIMGMLDTCRGVSATLEDCAGMLAKHIEFSTLNREEPRE